MGTTGKAKGGGCLNVVTRTKVGGRSISSMALASFFSTPDQSMKGSSKRKSAMDEATGTQMTARNMMESGDWICGMVEASGRCQMGACTKELLRTTSVMVKVR